MDACVVTNRIMETSTYITTEWQFVGKMCGEIPRYSTSGSKAIPDSLDSFDVFSVVWCQPKFFTY